MSDGRVLERGAVVGDELRVIEHPGDRDPAMALGDLLEMLFLSAAPSFSLAFASSASPDRSGQLALQAASACEFSLRLLLRARCRPGSCSSFSSAARPSSRRPSFRRPPASSTPAPRRAVLVLGFVLAVVGYAVPVVIQRKNEEALRGRDRRRARSAAISTGVSRIKPAPGSGETHSRDGLVVRRYQSGLDLLIDDLGEITVLDFFASRFWMIFSRSSWRSRLLCGCLAWPP